MPRSEPDLQRAVVTDLPRRYYAQMRSSGWPWHRRDPGTETLPCPVSPFRNLEWVNQDRAFERRLLSAGGCEYRTLESLAYTPVRMGGGIEIRSHLSWQATVRQVSRVSEVAVAANGTRTGSLDVMVVCPVDLAEHGVPAGMKPDLLP